MNGIGQILKSIRLERQISLEEIENVTKIRVKYLQAIEDDNFDDLPGEVYAKGFINSYIRFLGVGDLPEIKALRQTNKSVVNTVAPKVDEPPKSNEATRTSRVTREKKHKKTPERRVEEKPITAKKHWIIGLSVTALVLLIGIQVFYTNQFDKENPDQPNNLPPVIENPDANLPQGDDVIPPSEEEITPPPQDEYEGLMMTLTIIDANPNAVDKCWIRASGDGVVLFEETLSQGAVKEINATEKIALKLGNGGVVKLTLNGQDLGVVAQEGQVVNREFTIDSLNQ